MNCMILTEMEQDTVGGVLQEIFACICRQPAPIFELQTGIKAKAQTNPWIRVDGASFCSGEVRYFWSRRR